MAVGLGGEEGGWVFSPALALLYTCGSWAGNGRVTGGWTGIPGRRLISPPVGPQPLWGGAWGGHFPPAVRRGPPGFLERTRKCSRGWDLWLYPPVRESLDLLTSGEEVLRSVGFGFLSVCKKKPVFPALAAGAWSSRGAPRDCGLEEREWPLCIPRL